MDGARPHTGRGGTRASDEDGRQPRFSAPPRPDRRLATRPRLLYVGGDGEARAQAQDVLDASGYRCDAVAGADEVERCLRSHVYELLLCEIGEPSACTASGLRRVRAAHPDLGVVILVPRGVPALHRAALRLDGSGYLLTPFEQSELLFAVASVLRRRRTVEQQRDARYTHVQSLLAQRAPELECVRQDLERSRDEVRRAREEAVWRLRRTLERRDASVGVHAERVGGLCALLAERMGLDEQTCYVLRLAAPLHDIGKIAVPDSILRKREPLTRAEERIAARHPRIGYDILSGSESDLLETAAWISLTHHERFDGRGFPLGLHGAKIPLVGRVTAVANAFDVLLSRHDPPLDSESALETMLADRGRAFDPEVIDALAEVSPQLTAVHASSASPSCAASSQAAALPEELGDHEPPQSP